METNEYTWMDYDNPKEFTVDYVENTGQIQHFEHHSSSSTRYRFKCSHGAFSFCISTFPGNCGIAIIHSFYSDTVSPKELGEEFTHYIRTVSPCNLILITDNSLGQFTQLIGENNDWEKGTSVYNANSNNSICTYQTTKYNLNQRSNWIFNRVFPRLRKSYEEYFIAQNYIKPRDE